MEKSIAPEAVFGLTALQSGMVFQALLDEERDESAGYNVQQGVLALPEPMPADALRSAWKRTQARHPILRASFAWEGHPQPVMRIHDEVRDVVIDEHSWLGVGESECRARLAALLEADRRQGFDLRNPPLSRFHLCHCGPAGGYLVWSYHHILMDGRSFQLVLHELVSSMRALRDGREIEPRSAPRPFTDFSDWIAGHDSVHSLEFFRKLLQGKSAPTPLPGAEPAPLRSNGTGITTRLLGEDSSARLSALARESGSSLGMLVQAAWAIFLARWTGEEDVLFGSTRACRKSALAGSTADMVGMVINSLPVRVRCGEERTLRELLDELRALNLALREHEHTSIVDVQGVSEIRRGLALFDTVLMFENRELNHGMRALDPWWDKCSIELHEQPVPPLVLTAFGGERLKLRLLYDKRRFREPAIERMLEHLCALLSRMTQHLDRPLGSLDCMPQEERQQVLFDWNDSARAFRDELCIQQLFEEQVERRPDAEALVCDGVALTFRELEERSNKLANALIARGLGPGSHVAFLLERSLELVVTMLGIAKSGAAYVPVDPAYPAARARFMVEDTRAGLVITQPLYAGRFAGLPQLHVGADEIARASSERPARRARAQDVCYVIYTSGSTGVPKGVVLTHRAVVNTLEWVNRSFGVGPGDRLLFVTSPGFDLSVYDVFGALGAGATVEIATSAMLQEPARLALELAQPGITIWNSAPAALSLLVPFLPARAPDSTLRLALLSGDWIPVKLPDELRAVFPLLEPKSLGGATEAAIWSNFHEIGAVDPAWRSIPYGRPIQNARYYILDRRMQPAPVGVAGDLYIGGACLAQGYHGRAELTAERFLPDPFLEGERIYKTGDLARFAPGGTIEFLGRADFQVKVRGFRVELGEVEAALLALPGVRETVCTTRFDSSGERAIVAYAVPRDAGQLDARALRAALVGTLPSFMLPSAIVILERLPLLESGKLDRGALPDPALELVRDGVVAARTPLEAQLVELWERVLQQKPIGIHDDFFELGGHSLLAVLLVARAQRDLGLQLPLSALLATPTIAGLAESLGDAQPGTGPKAAPPLTSLVELHAGGDRPPLYLVAGIGGEVFTFRELAKSLGPDQPVFAFTTDRIDDEGLPQHTVEAIAELYAQEIEERGVPDGPLVFGGYSFGALVALELVHRFRARGRNVGGLIVFDGFAPGYPAHMPLFERIFAHWKALARLDLAGCAGYVRERAENVRRKLLMGSGFSRQLAPRIAGADTEREKHRQRSWGHARRAQAIYRPRTIDQGPLLLFVAEIPIRWPATRMDDSAMGWCEWVHGRIEIVPVKGAHLDVFRGDNVEPMAREIRSAIDKLVPVR